MKKEKRISIDQMTLNFPMKPVPKGLTIPDEVIDIIRLLHLSEVFDSPTKGKTGMNGYTSYIRWGLAETGAITALFNLKRHDMGISLVITGKGKKIYEELCRQHDIDIDWKEIIKVVYKKYKGHLTRIDVAFDFINYNFSVNSIHEKLMNKEYVFLNARDQKVPLSRLKFIGMDGVIQTITVGSRRSDAFLRIYDKRSEQIEKKGIEVAIAYSSKDWVRVEGEFKHRQARSLGSEISSLAPGSINSYLASQVIRHWKLIYEDG